MRTKAEIISLLTNPGIVPIVRTQSPAAILPLAEALIAGGLKAVEITMTVPNAVEIIRQASAQFGKDVLIGAGTVLDEKTCRAVMDAGADFIVTPVLRPNLVKVAHDAGRVTMIGAYTASEAQAAYEAGSDFIKIFPADTLGPNYIKSLKAPLPHLNLVPTGGVNLQNIGEWFKAGVSAVGVGTALVSAQILKDQNWAELKRLTSEFVKAANAARAK
jgi:2-dehydro-3-deoxyphosphogluconate aldolase / (4S)-4-hydroxy-2-oxoglutarate aldolase